MGISATNARLILDCHRRGVVFGRTLMLGRQNVYMSGPEYAKLLDAMGFASEGPPRGGVMRSGEFAEGFFMGLGATSVESMDASDFEGATRVHDLNTPIPEAWWGLYDLVYDGGTLEHVFDFPRAMGNAMRMVKPGGRLILHTPSNNWMGHGLYQFSPELFFRVLGPTNGYEMDRVLVVEAGVSVDHYEALDPSKARVRGELANRAPTWLHVEARRTGDVPEALGHVLQSDYQARWSAHGTDPGSVQHLADPHHGVPLGVRRFLLERFPVLTRRLERFVGIYLSRSNSLRNRSAYRRVRF